MASMFWNMIYNQNSADAKDFQGYIQKDDLISILKSDKLKNELQNSQSQVPGYLAKPNNISKMLDFLYDPSPEQERKQLNTAVNDIVMMDNPVILDAIAASDEFIEKIFTVLLPYNDNEMRRCKTEELPALPAIKRRVPLTCAENFCRLVFTLIKPQGRFQKVLQFLSEHLHIMDWFAYSIQSAAITETLHYIFKVDKSQEIQDLQCRIITQSKFIERLYSLFTDNGIFEELVHVAFVFQSFLTTEMKAEIKKTIMTNLPSIVTRVLTPTAHPSLVRNIYTIIAITIKQTIRMGILSEKPDAAKFYADTLQNIMDGIVPKFTTYLQMQMANGVVTNANLYITHTCTVISEILKIQESTLDYIREKEQLLINHQYSPEVAIQYLTTYYKQNTGQPPLPLVIGFSFIFQDVYLHLHETTKFKFDQAFVKQITHVHQAQTKNVSTIHLFGPNKELCLGSIEYVISIFMQKNIFGLLLQQACANPEASIIHYALQLVISILSEYLPQQINFGAELLNDAFFKQMRQTLCNIPGGHSEDVEALKLRIAQPAHRVSLDALAVHCVQKMAEKTGQITGECLQLAQLYEVKEALGM